MKRLGKALLTIGLLGSSAAAFSAISHQTITWYYSDATYTELVGEVTALCSNTVWIEGEITPYARVIERKKCDTIGVGSSP